MIEKAPWLPCPRCGLMAPDCIETPVHEVVWEKLLERSRNKRLGQQHAAEYERLHQRWAA